MAKAGLYVPVEADPTRISIEMHMRWFDKVLADIGDSQSLQQSLSTFSGHVRRLTDILNVVCQDSLVLLDEIGTGTDPTEGAALAAAVLNELSEVSGLTVATTHHAEIKELADSHPTFLNASMEFDAATLKPTYRLIWGSTGQSNALDICSALNFDAGVVQEARGILQKGILQQEQARHVEDSLREKLNETLEQRGALLKTQKETKSKLSKKEKKLKQMEAKEASLTEALATYQHQDSEIDRDVDWILEQVRNQELTTEEAEGCLDELLKRAPKPETDNQAPPWYPEVGSMIRLKHLGGRTGRVLSATPGKTVKVECGVLSLDVPIWYVEPLHDDASEQSTSKVTVDVTTHLATRTQSSANTLDLRGMHVDDAIEQLEQAVDTRFDTEVLYVVHGRGNGAMKAAVHGYLARSHRVRRYAEEGAPPGGCTAVDLWM